MSAEVVNLRRVRKAKLRAGQAAQADANRARFGRTRVERQAEADVTDRAARHLDGHRLERESDDGGA